MKLVESNAELLIQEPGIEGIYKIIEKASRTCYKSEDKITEDSAKGFVERMIKSNHTAMLEHGTVYLAIPITEWNSFEDYSYGYLFNSYSKVNDSLVDWERWEGIVYITTNYRVLIENNWLDDLQYLCSPTEFHEKRYTMRFTCSRAIANELVRHRVFSFSQESTRYVNYSKERHGGEITCIEPSWNYKYNDDKFEGAEDWNPYMRALWQAESSYFEMISDGCTPQQARDVLPNATKTELNMTGFTSDWKFLFDLRLYGKTGKPHPDMVQLMEKALEVFLRGGVWKDIENQPSRFNQI